MARTKFNVSKDKSRRTYNEIVFASELEMRYYKEIAFPALICGKAIKLELQKKYELQPKFIKENKTIRAIDYVADFYIEYADGTTEVIDTKGFPDPVAKLKRKMFWYLYPELNYRWLTYVKKYGGWIDYDEYESIKKAEKKNKRSK